MPPIFRPHERGPPGNRGARIYTWQVGRAYPWSRGNLYISSDVRKNNVCTKGFWTLYLHTLEMGHNGSKSRPESVALEFCPRERETNRSENIPSQSRQKLKACPCHPFLTCSIWKWGDVRIKENKNHLFWSSKVARSIQLEFADSLVNFDALVLTYLS
jgi:hypothetical protein